MPSVPDGAESGAPGAGEARPGPEHGPDHGPEHGPAEPRGGAGASSSGAAPRGPNGTAGAGAGAGDAVRVEFSVLAKGFANLDLLQQGQYEVRCSLTVGPEAWAAGVVEGVVYTKVGQKQEALRGGLAYTFRQALVKYIDQREELNQFIRFRAAVPLRYLDSCHLVFELLFSEMEEVGPDKTVLRPLKKVAEETYHVDLSAGSVQEYLPIIFDKFYLSLLDTYVVVTPLERTSAAGFKTQAKPRTPAGRAAPWSAFGALPLFGALMGSGGSGSGSGSGSAASGGGGVRGGTRLDRGAPTPGTCACRACVGTDAAAVAGVLRNALRKSIDLAICTKAYHSKGSRVFSHGGETPDSVLQGLVARAKACLREEDEGGEDGSGGGGDDDAGLRAARVAGFVEQLLAAINGALDRGDVLTLGHLRNQWQQRIVQHYDPWVDATDMEKSRPNSTDALDVGDLDLDFDDVLLGTNLHDVRYWSEGAEIPVCNLLKGETDGTRSRSGSATPLRNNGAEEDKGAPNDPEHYVFFVHGFQGDPQDLRVIRGYMTTAAPEIKYVMSKSNHHKQSDSLEAMGHRLAAEVLEALEQRTASRKNLKLSFVGHCVGTLVIRAAVADPLLNKFRPNLWSFVSFCGPHLGYRDSENKLLHTGMLLLQHLRNVKWIKEVRLTDAERLEDCYLYKLARTAGLGCFHNVFLIGSEQDRYVPFPSAMVGIEDAGDLGGDEHGAAYRQMLQSMLAGTGTAHSKQLIRCSVQFPANLFNALDSYIGRGAHVAFVEDDSYVKMVVYTILRKYSLL